MEIDTKNKMIDAVKAYGAKIAAIRMLPEYQEYLSLKNEVDDFNKFFKKKRINRLYEYILELIDNDHDYNIKSNTSFLEFIARIKKLETRLEQSAYKRSYTAGHNFSSSNITKLLFDVFKKHGKKVKVFGMFSNCAYQIDVYTMEQYSGQGLTGYNLTMPKSIL